LNVSTEGLNSNWLVTLSCCVPIVFIRPQKFSCRIMVKIYRRLSMGTMVQLNK